MRSANSSPRPVSPAARTPSSARAWSIRPSRSTPKNAAPCLKKPPAFHSIAANAKTPCANSTRRAAISIASATSSPKSVRACDNSNGRRSALATMRACRPNCKRCSAPGLAITGARVRPPLATPKLRPRRRAACSPRAASRHPASASRSSQSVSGKRSCAAASTTGSAAPTICTRKPKPYSVNLPCSKSARAHCRLRSSKPRSIELRSRPRSPRRPIGWRRPKRIWPKSSPSAIRRPPPSLPHNPP